MVADKIIAVAPMIDCTDRHARYFMRLLAKRVQLYTEMITTHALIHGDYQRLLQYDPAENYLALQLGGQKTSDLALCAKMGEDFAYDEINLNVGCPSPRVAKGAFGACLMLQPLLVAECIAAMQKAVKIPVTVKCRIGVDQQDTFEQLLQFIAIVASAGCKKFIIHARKAWLSGLSPKENREIPPLNYDVVYAIKQHFPHLTIVINGGIKSITAIDEQFKYVDGVMIGREAYHNPYILAQIQQAYDPQIPTLSRHQVIDSYQPYIETQLQQGVRLHSMTRHLLGLFQGQKGARAWRRTLSEQAPRGHSSELLQQALRHCES